MKRRVVELSDDAIEDLNALYDWIALKADPVTAFAYIERLENYCRGFDVASERGESRDNIRPGLRVTGFEGRITIAFTVEETRVVILRFFYGGRDWPVLI